MNEPLLLRGGSVVTGDCTRPGMDVRIVDGRITAIGPDLGDTGMRVVDVRGGWVAPGFIDLHVHGAGGAMFEDACESAVANISRALVAYGTTGVLATIATLPVERLQAAVEAIAPVAGAEPGARILGIHLEGPFLNRARGGAQSAAWMRMPSIVEVEDLQRRSGGLIRMVTLAPELPGALDLIRWLRAHEIVAAIGHTAASEADISAAVAAGARHVTHLYNAMAPLHHREPGMVGSALTNDLLSVELIADGHHVHPRAIDIALRCKSPGAIIVVSDAVAALGLADGAIDLLGMPCVIRNGAVRARDGGQLAGSCVSLSQAVRNLVAWQPARRFEEIMAMVTRSPARIADVADRVGVVELGAEADLVLLTRSLEVAATIRRGEMVWSVDGGGQNCS